ncbi:hypothetical protein BC833DRAFT_590836 [Globomyces pollinis-pini]|nr:hypothetical protein BC833DRAFT_590836 [Globomyces pollinis-pini]
MLIAVSLGSSWMARQKLLPNNPKIQKHYIQPTGERSYKNSSKIVHNFGPTGFAGLAPLSSTSNKQKTIPIMIVWAQSGKVVHLTGTFNNWKKKIRLQKSAEDFSTIVDMPPGKHHLKFIVDDEWKCSEDLPIASDEEGNVVNCLEVTDEDGMSLQDGLDDIGLDGIPLHKTPDSPKSSYTCLLPLPVRNDDVSNREPPMLPAQLQKVLLNSKAVSTHEPYLLPVPNHVSVNHLYACSIRDGVMAIASTSRYHKKYVTTVLYKPVSDL